MATRSRPEMAKYRQNMKLPPFVSCFIPGTRSSRTNQPTALAYQVYCCTYCCTFCFLIHTRSSCTKQLTAPRVPGVLLYVLLHCCAAVCSKGLVGGWVEDALTASSGVGGLPVIILFS